MVSRLRALGDTFTPFPYVAPIGSSREAITMRVESNDHDRSITPIDDGEDRTDQ
jgi:hypothetical protein